MSLHSELAPRLEVINQRIESAAQAAGRDPATIRLVAVSKRKSVDLIRAAYDLGVRDFGENYAQELRDKAKELNDLPEIRWHFIGPLQRNKARYIAGVVHTFHTLASASLAEALDKRLVDKTGKAPLRVLLQLNLSGEESKSGISEHELEPLLQSVRSHPHLQCEGLMTMPPTANDPREVAPIFERLSTLAAAHGLEQLSMGMSHDFEVAIAAGATLIRVGSSIFGARAPL
ncbi:MAG: YggS family pyridoxal phosphate-dependent enzyme [Deltaproteobacteria bacterium]|nr:YggS family pyridoxal phosphate-dependent enzyme [Deltaproteobacteria bacterium]